jgi:hypothetical protein
MTITELDFERQLEPVGNGWIVDRSDFSWRFRQEMRVVTVTCQTLPIRKIGWLELPRLAVEIGFEKCNKEEEARFLQRFHRCFQRGGG